MSHNQHQGYSAPQTFAKPWMQPKGLAQNLNPLSPHADNYCEKLYKSYLDGQGGFQEKVLRACETLDIDTKDLMPRKLEEFTEGGRVEEDMAKVRHEHFNSKRKAKLLAVNQQILFANSEANSPSKLMRVHPLSSEYNLAASQGGVAGPRHGKILSAQTSPGKLAASTFLTSLTNDLPTTTSANRGGKSTLVSAAASPSHRVSFYHTAGPPRSSLGFASGVSQGGFGGGNSLPDIAASECLLREMQREKERLQRFFASKERSAAQAEALEKRARELLAKKQAKLAKIEDRLRKQAKEERRAALDKDVSRGMKRKFVEDARQEVVKQSEELYWEHLKEVRSKREERAKRQRDSCELEYKRHTESLNRSLNNYQAALKDRQQLEIVTERNLSELEARLAVGWTRSQVRKEELKQHAAETLQNLPAVREAHSRLEAEAQNERLARYLDRRRKQLAHLQKWEKQRQKLAEEAKHRQDSKQGTAKLNQQQADEELQRLGETIEGRFQEHARRMEEFRDRRDHENALRHEKEHLRFEDQQANLLRRKRMIEKEKLKIVQKHLQMEEKLQKQKEQKAHLLEYHRIANELRLNSSRVSPTAAAGAKTH